MSGDGYPSQAEVRRLEAEADRLLKADAKERGFIRENGRGFSAYARSIGITTRKILETTYKHEAAVSVLMPDPSVGHETKLDVLAHGMDKIEQGSDQREEA